MKFRINNLLWAGLLVAGVASWFFGPEAGTFLLAGSVVTGVRATEGTQKVLANVRVVDMSDTIHLLDPNMAPLTAISMKLRKAHCINPEVEWLEDDYLPATDTIAATATTAATTFVMNNGVRFRAGDVLKALETGEVIYVSAASGNTLTVTRQIGDTAAAQYTPNDTFLRVGDANAENATKRAVKTVQKDPLHNFTQIFRWPFGASGTLMASELYGGNDLTYQSRKSGLEHRIQMERAYLFGEKAEDTSGATALRYCDGVINRISTNITTQQTLTADVLETFLRTGFRYGPASKMLFASRAIISFINNIARANIETIPASKSFPLALTEYVSGHGKCYLVTHNLLEGTGGNNYAYDGWALLLDMDSVWHRYLQGRDTKLRQNIQANDEDGRTDEYLSECCPMIIQEKFHSILRNVQAYA